MFSRFASIAIVMMPIAQNLNAEVTVSSVTATKLTLVPGETIELSAVVSNALNELYSIKWCDGTVLGNFNAKSLSTVSLGRLRLQRIHIQ